MGQNNQKVREFARELKSLMIKYGMNFLDVGQALAILNADIEKRRLEELLNPDRRLKE